MAAVARRQRRATSADPAHDVLTWYDRERRDLPWRSPPGQRADPYRVWLSEIMLQQTTVKAVIPFYLAFLARWPSVHDLANAPEADVLAAWAGLGYYTRARNLHRCANVVVRELNGRFPEHESGLRALPGIGPYTAAAIAAIAFGQPSTPVDGNIERVIARLFGIETPLPAAKPELKRLAATLTPAVRAGDYAQAMMDLGATVCTPRRPSCLMCPLAGNCRARADGTTGVLPRRSPKPERPQRHGAAFVALREDGHVLLRRRPAQGLLAGMVEVPGTAWLDEETDARDLLRTAPVRADWWRVAGVVTHTFTHFRLELAVYRAIVRADDGLTFWAEPDRCFWVARQAIGTSGLPTVMRKVVAHALQGH
jgi:A/G-specific adenine glycosylase